MTERQGVEIDDCPKCRGVWLDRGESDKILDKAAAEAPARPMSQPERAYERPREYRDRDDDDHRRHYGHHHHRRKKSLLSDILDF